MRTDPAPALARLAVSLLAPARHGERDLELGAARAIEQGLAGIYSAGLDGKRLRAGEALTAARRQEVLNHFLSTRHMTHVLGMLGSKGVIPLVLKGRPLAERLWPRSDMRPAGDLDLLISGEQLGGALAVLLRAGYRPVAGPDSEPGRPTCAGVELSPPDGRWAVDLHTRTFRTVGGKIAAESLLARSLEGRIEGFPIRVLEPADEILYLLVHAAKHGAVQPRWLLDIAAAYLRYGQAAWEQARERAALSQALRPFTTAERLMQKTGLPRPPRRAVRRTAGPFTRLLLDSVVRLDPEPGKRGLSQVRRYAMEWLLEDSKRLRFDRMLGAARRMARGAGLRRASRAARPIAALASSRWVERRLAAGGPEPQWMSLSGSSMEPSVPAGSRLLVQPIGPGREPDPGDIVVVRRDGLLVAHRLLRSGRGAIVTRGDALSKDDAPLPETDLLGRVIAVNAP